MQINSIIVSILIVFIAQTGYTIALILLIRRYYWPDYIEFTKKLLDSSNSYVTQPTRIPVEREITPQDLKEPIDANKEYLKS